MVNILIEYSLFSISLTYLYRVHLINRSHNMSLIIDLLAYSENLVLLGSSVMWKKSLYTYLTIIQFETIILLQIIIYLHIHILDLEQHFELCVTKRLLVYVVSTMPVFQCPIEGYAFQTDHFETDVAPVLLTIQNNVHLSTPVSSNAWETKNLHRFIRRNLEHLLNKMGVSSNAVQDSPAQSLWNSYFIVVTKIWVMQYWKETWMPSTVHKKIF